MNPILFIGLVTIRKGLYAKTRRHNWINFVLGNGVSIAVFYYTSIPWLYAGMSVYGFVEYSNHQIEVRRGRAQLSNLAEYASQKARYYANAIDRFSK